MAFRKVDLWLVRDQLKESAPGVKKNHFKQGARHAMAGMALKRATKQKTPGKARVDSPVKRLYTRNNYFAVDRKLRV